MLVDFMQSLTEEGSIKRVFVNASGAYLTGFYANINTNTAVWYNGATYVMGYEDTSSNNRALIFKFKDGQIQYSPVGSVDSNDVLQHAYPTVLVIGGFLYVFQTNGHNAFLNIWKSNLAESILDGWTLHHRINVDTFSYCSPRLLPDGRVLILSRSNSPFNQIVAISAPNDLTSWTAHETTEADYSVKKIRHYPAMPRRYGNNTKVVLGISLRNDETSPPCYFAQAWYDYDPVNKIASNRTGWSKDIGVNGKITEAELEANCTIAGSISNTTLYHSGFNAAQIDDVIYNSYFDYANSEWKFQKIDVNGTLTEYPCPIQNLSTTEPEITYNQLRDIFIYYNGNNLVILAEENVINGDSDWNVYACDLNFGNFQFKENISLQGEEKPINRPSIPANLDEVEGDYIIAGSNVPNQFPYLITNDKFLI